MFLWKRRGKRVHRRLAIQKELSCSLRFVSNHQSTLNPKPQNPKALWLELFMLTAKPSDDEASLPRRLLRQRFFQLQGLGCLRVFSSEFTGAYEGLLRSTKVFLLMRSRYKADYKGGLMRVLGCSTWRFMGSYKWGYKQGNYSYDP